MDLFSPATRRDPYPLYDQLRAASPVLHLPGPDLWVVFGHDAVKRVLSDHETFSSNVGPSRGNRFEWLLFMDPPRHTQLRAIVGRAFTARSIAGLAPRIRALAGELLDRVGDPDCDRGELDLVADLAAPLPMMVIAELLGLPIDDWRRLAGWNEAIVNLGNTIAGGDAAHAAAGFARADAEMTGYLAAVIAARRAEPTGAVRRRARAQPAPGLRPRHPLLPRRAAVAARGRHRARRAARAVRAARARVAGLAAARVVPRPRPGRVAGAVPPHRVASPQHGRHHRTRLPQHHAAHAVFCAGLRAPQNAPRCGGVRRRS